MRAAVEVAASGALAKANGMLAVGPLVKGGMGCAEHVNAWLIMVDPFATLPE